MSQSGSKALEISTDIRVELISTVIYLSDLKDRSIVVTAEELGSDTLNQRFAYFVNHPAVSTYPAIWDIGIWWDMIPLLALHLTDDITLQDSYWQHESLWICTSEERYKLLEFVSNLRDFFYAANFEQYYRETLPQNTEFIAVLNALLAAIPLQNILEDYIGEKLPPAHIRLMNLLKSFFGAWTDSKTDKQVYCFCSRHWLQIAQGNKHLEGNLYNSVWHEFLHSVINPLSDQLFPGGITTTEEQSTWYCALNESIIWAISGRLCHQIGNLKDSDNSWYFSNARNCKAPKAEELYILLLEYESNRAKYPGIKDFHPILQKEFGPIPI